MRMNSLKIISDLLEGQVVPLLRALQLNTVEKHGVMGAVGGAGHTRPGEICDVLTATCALKRFPKSRADRVVKIVVLE